MALPAHVYHSEAWRHIAEYLRAEIARLQVVNEDLLPEREADRNRGRIALARRLLRDAETPAPRLVSTPPDYAE